jgi:hypothetical protein
MEVMKCGLLPLMDAHKEVLAFSKASREQEEGPMRQRRWNNVEAIRSGFLVCKSNDSTFFVQTLANIA